MIDFNMKDFISKKLEIPIEQAFKIQKNFYKKYGTTLFGLMKYYDIDPDEFLDYVHNIDFSKLKKNDELNQYLKLLPGKKIVFTNGDENYASKVLCSLGIIDNIDEIYDIKKGNYIPKPKIETYRNLISSLNVIPRKTVFFEDIEKNLKPAHDLGFTTVHIDFDSDNCRSKKQKKYIDFKFKCIKSALKMIIKLTKVK
ncbi:pyrimidine 5'-nucleotidase [Alphaproteobacteria bacterium]|nr:pyrimidine 5'-nucleotidase [Alphaproteobacteria bacterium]